MANLTQLIGEAQELHAYSVRCLYRALAEDISQVSLPLPSSGSPAFPTLGFEWFSPQHSSQKLVEDKAHLLLRLLSWPWCLPTATPDNTFFRRMPTSRAVSRSK